MAAFKDYFDREAAKALSTQLKSAYPSFDSDAFVKNACRGLGKLEMMGRVGQFADAIKVALPADTAKALQVLRKSLGPEAEGTEDVMNNGYLLWPYGEYIRRHTAEHFDEALVVMVELTKRFSSEFAVRTFVREQPERILPALLKLTTHENPHVRRWCSEGVRPRLPWGERLVALSKDPSPILGILEALKDDESLYVRRSVANAWGDIAKDHPDLAVKTMKRWSVGATENRRWLVRHALRTLVKAGHPGALALMGYRPTAQLDVSLELSPQKVSIGKHVHIHCAVTNTARSPVALLLDFRIHYLKSNGVTKPKVFKWKELKLKAGETIELDKKHSMKKTSIRPLYLGEHHVDLQINGKTFGEASFSLKD